jgi:hypothetical protein
MPRPGNKGASRPSSRPQKGFGRKSKKTRLG